MCKCIGTQALPSMITRSKLLSFWTQAEKGVKELEHFTDKRVMANFSTLLGDVLYRISVWEDTIPIEEVFDRLHKHNLFRHQTPKCNPEKLRCYNAAACLIDGLSRFLYCLYSGRQADKYKDYMTIGACVKHAEQIAKREDT